MKKVIAFSTAFFLLLSGPAVFAQMPLAVPAGAPAPVSFERIGIVAAMHGKVELKTPGQIGRIASSGQPIFMKDEVKTDAGGHLQILLLDETVFTIGPNSSITIDEFVYDPKSHGGEIRASIAKGVFRYVSGKIAAKNSKSVSMKLPTSTIGFRGTIVGGAVGDGGQGLVALLGPGDNNDAGVQNGSFSIDGQGGDHQDVNRTGFGVEVGANGGLSGVFQLSDSQLNGLTSGLSPSGNQGGDGSGSLGGGSVTDQSGETGAITGQNTGLVNGLNGLLNSNNDTSNTAAQDAAASSERSEAIANGVTTAEQLSRITTGQYHYSGTGAFTETVSGNGTVQAAINIDFGAKTIGGGNSFVSINSTNITGSKNIATHSFTEATGGQAVFTDVSGSFNTTIKLQNSGGVIANSASIQENYTGSPYSGNGVVSAPRTPGNVAT